MYNLRQRIERLERGRQPDFCAACMVVRFVDYVVPAPGAGPVMAPGQVDRPATCPKCGREPGDYGGVIRGFRVIRPYLEPEAQPPASSGLDAARRLQGDHSALAGTISRATWDR